MLRALPRVLWTGCIASLSLWACGEPPHIGGDGDDSSSDADESGDSSGGDDLDGADGVIDDGSDEGDADEGDADDDGGVSDPCPGLGCGAGQRCELEDGVASCVDNDCAELDCSATELCAPAEGGGFVCRDNSCDADVDCPANRFCDGSICVDDVCSPGTASCSGDELSSCASNGSGHELLYACAGGPYFESTCGAQPTGTGCSCQDEWDCPLDTTCDMGRCVGTGKAPTCRLEPVPFDTVLPAREFHWGGLTGTNSPALGSPFPSSSSVGTTPLVVNLDDDNGDGLVNERDFPEIVFISYRNGDDVRRNGVVRAIHATGEPRGADYFALCGDTLWQEGQPVLDDSACTFGGSDATQNAQPYAMPGGALAAGDIDGDGFPEIVVPTTRRSLLVLDRHGAPITESEPFQWPGGVGKTSPSSWNFSTVALANLDHAGLAEAVVGNRVFTFRQEDVGGVPTLRFDRVFVGARKTGVQSGATEFGPVVCLADVHPDYAGLELVAGSTAYHLPEAPDGGCSAAENAAHPYCTGALEVVWDTQTTFGTNEASGGLSNAHAEGFCAVADVLGASGAAPGDGVELDERPEVVLIADGYLVILDGETGERLQLLNLGGGTIGGAPNIDDFDGDGFPEIATALANFYRVIDLQAPSAACPAWGTALGKIEASPGSNAARAPGGACDADTDCAEGAVCGAAGSCVCLHNGWFRTTEDDSSKATSSSVFDFNGDGAAEVAYNDECYFRVYDGASGAIYLAIPSISRTVIENPVIADVDNDGNAEIVTVANTDLLQCGESTLTAYPSGETQARAALNPGLEIWGEATDAWVSARRVWNQQSYHVTNVTEAGALPTHEPENYLPYGGRLYNSYRSQPRVYGSAPNLTLTAMEISSPDVACGELSSVIDVVVEVKNVGDLRVGPGVTLAFHGEWAPPTVPGPLLDGDGRPIEVVLSESLEPGASVLVPVRFDGADGPSGELPLFVSAIIDSESAERECVESDNSIEAAVDPGESLADLRLTFVGSSSCSQTRVRVENVGSATATGVDVTVYLGDPASGGQARASVRIADSLAPGAAVERNVPLGTLSRSVVLHGLVDPENVIAECNNQNNLARGPSLVCQGGVN